MAGPYVVCGLGGERIMNYISRFIIGTGLLVGVLVSGGCRKHTWRDQPLRPEDTALVDAMLILRCNDLQTKAEATREEQEKQINDLNLFFVHKHYPSVANPEVRHYYFSSVDVTKRLKLTNIRLGKYRLYAVANAGKSLYLETSHDPEASPATVSESMCSMTEQEIKDLEINYSVSPNKAGNFPMSSVDENMEIKWAKHEGVEVDEGDIVPISITLKRKVAKYEFSYELMGPAIGKMEINTVALQSVPGSISLFKPSSSSPTYLDKVLGVSPNTNNLSFYALENMQGDVPGITSEEQRNPQTAPENASYLFLDGKYEDTQYGMSLYLGDDMQGGNFDVEGNAHYHMHLKLGGPNTDDVRVSSLKFIASELPPLIPSLEEQVITVEIICANYLNDEISLICSATGGRNKDFRVRKLDDLGNEETTDLPDISDEPGESRFAVIPDTGNEPGIQRKKCRVYFQMESGSSVVVLMAQTRYGRTTFSTQETTVE